MDDHLLDAGRLDEAKNDNSRAKVNISARVLKICYAGKLGNEAN